jgi:hypothetical protein
VGARGLQTGFVLPRANDEGIQHYSALFSIIRDSRGNGTGRLKSVSAFAKAPWRTSKVPGLGGQISTGNTGNTVTFWWPNEGKPETGNI